MGEYPLVFIFTLGFVFLSILITYLTLNKGQSTSEFYVAGNQVPWVQVGIAMVGSYLSAASFLGVAGDIAIKGVDRIWLAIGFFGGYMALLMLIAGPLRNVGSYTVADALYRRFPDDRIKLIVMVTTLVISTFYLVPQVLGAGLVFELLLGWNFLVTTIGIGVLISLYIIYGGMKATLYNQVVQAIFLWAAMVVIVIAGVFMFFDGSINKIFETAGQIVPPSIAGPNAGAVAASAAAVSAGAAIDPALAAKYGTVIPASATAAFTAVRASMPDAATAMTIGVQTPSTFAQISTVLALVFGTAGLPHILIMFFTVPSASAAKKSVTLCVIALGIFYFCSIFLGFITLILVYPQLIAWIGAGKVGMATNMAVLKVAEMIGGQWLMAISTAGAVAAILSTAAGLMITCASTISHDFYKVYINKEATEAQEINIAKLTTVIMSAIAVLLAYVLKGENVAWLVTLAFGIAASAIFPTMIATLWWKKFTRQAALAGMSTGLGISVIFIVLLLSGVKEVFGLSVVGGPGIFGVTVGILVVVLVSLFTNDYGKDVNGFFALAHKTEKE
ncbi:MAG TPA: cation acetate symporter [Candidatus Ozemobacteraceae bacterium]|nr:cation acetate symporter [Candidatus Ozemobacteraceae bacterium]